MQTALGRAIATVAGILATSATTFADPPPNKHDKASQAEGLLVLHGAQVIGPLEALWAEQFARAQNRVAIRTLPPTTRGGLAAVVSGKTTGFLIAGSLGKEQTQSLSQALGKGGFSTIKVAALDLVAMAPKGTQLSHISTLELRKLLLEKVTWGTLKGYPPTGPLSAERVAVQLAQFRQLGPATPMYRAITHSILKGVASPLHKEIRLHRSLRAVALAVTRTPGAIGLVGAGFDGPGTRRVPIRLPDGTLSMPGDRRYPLSIGFSYVVRRHGGGATRGPTLEFLRYILSTDGQRLAPQGGLRPLSASDLQTSRQALRNMD